MKSQIAVIGAGVIGLSSGIRLLEQGYPVTLFARDLINNLASRGAPAIWEPYKALPIESILRWARTSLEIYKEFAPASGVQPIDLQELYHVDMGYPLWSKILDIHHELSAAQLPPEYARGFLTQTFLIDTTIYLDYLMDQFRKLGGQIFQKEFTQLQEVASSFPIIINCSGLGSCHLVPDPETFPIRGQYLITEKVPALNKISFATQNDENYILIVPRINDCYIGGTTIDHEWSNEVDATLSQQLLAQAQVLEPALKNVKVLDNIVCLRPGRKAVRLERETLPDQRTVIHNYGHGGSGITVSWGCAADVVTLVEESL
jgi:D-amino-acid oxidase